jgi:hypothetical protein
VWSINPLLTQPLVTNPHAEGFKQRRRFLQVGRVKSFGEPTIDVRQDLAGFGLPAFLLKDSAQTHDRTQFKRFRFLTAGNLDGPMKGGFGFCGFALQFAFQPMQLRFRKPFVRLSGNSQRLGDRRERFFDLPNPGMRFREQG